jgi:carbonic anhydrase
MAQHMPRELADGYRRLRQGRLLEEESRYRKLAEGQTPRTMIIACADSRVDPATIFAAGPGELFVVRNVAAIVPPCDPGGGYHGTSAAIEFAVSGLQVENIVVMGHGLCGGIAAALAAAEDRPVGQFIGPWVGLIRDVRDELIARVPKQRAEERQRALERMAVQQSLDNLMTFPFLAEAVEAGRLRLAGAWFAIMEGELHWLDWDSGAFEAVNVD